MLEKNIMIKINDKIYDKKIGLPQLISLMVFKNVLNDDQLKKLVFD